MPIHFVVSEFLSGNYSVFPYFLKKAYEFLYELMAYELIAAIVCLFEYWVFVKRLFVNVSKFLK